MRGHRRLPVSLTPCRRQIIIIIIIVIILPDSFRSPGKLKTRGLDSMFAVNLRIAFAGEWFGAEYISSLAEIAISMRPKAD